MQRMPAIDAAHEEIADIPKIKQRLQQLGHSTQSVQEQILLLKRQTADVNDRSLSRCSSLRSSVMLNPAMMGLSNKRASKSLSRFFVAEQESQQQSSKGGPSPLWTADTVPEKSEQEETSSHARVLPTTETKESQIEECKQSTPRQRSHHVDFTLICSSMYCRCGSTSLQHTGEARRVAAVWI